MKVETDTITLNKRLEKQGGPAAVTLKFKKRVWETTDVSRHSQTGALMLGDSGGLSPAEMVKLLNYAEDLKCRAQAKSAAEPKARKAEKVMEAMMWVMGNPDQTFATDLKGLGTQSEREEYLLALYDEEIESKVEVKLVAPTAEDLSDPAEHSSSTEA